MSDPNPYNQATPAEQSQELQNAQAPLSEWVQHIDVPEQTTHSVPVIQQPTVMAPPVIGQPIQATPQPTQQAQPVVSPPVTVAIPQEQQSMPLIVEKQSSMNAITSDESDRARKLVQIIDNSYSAMMVGQGTLKRNLLVCLLANSHTLLESVPGLAKSLAASTLASTISGKFNRIQCTADLMPSDISGSQIFNQSKNTFDTQLGPVFANIVLVDEINRSSAKSQSAMLEAMAERQVSIGDKTYQLPDPFMVIATQNPIESEGVYTLAEAQLDRFLIKDILTYPAPQDELEILNRVESGILNPRKETPKTPIETITPQDVLFLQDVASRVYIDTAIKQYIINLVYATRNPKQFLPERMAAVLEVGASPRATIGLMIGAKALALLSGRTNVIPEDVKALRYEILRHRLNLSFEADMEGITAENIIDTLFNVVPVP